ncbi:branched-chain amino acid ABC transporter substrate-binding protein [Mesorhizobium sp. ANAO-SY3R2]|uniref:branched-chain amino acid ABC transporter substrate-binding protein n=1 Tax=Mesorhizobium sp. ANAO-SY3R2 TaxID=3166644 RepID=UPI0036728109
MTFSHRFGAWIAVILAILSALVFPAIAQEKATLRIAVAAPMSGQFAQMGEQIRQGAELAIEDINASGGIGGQKLQIDVVDDKGDGMTAKAVARNLAKSGVRFVVGHFNSGASIPASEVYAKMGVFMISPASTNPSLTERSGKGKNLWNTHRTAGRDDVQGRLAGEYIAKAFAGRNAAILSDGTPYGDGLAIKAKAALNAAGQAEKLMSKVKVGQKDMSRLIASMNDKKIDVVFFGGLANEMATLVRQSSEAGFTPQFIAGDGIFTADFPHAAGAGVARTMFAFSLEDRQHADAQSVVARFRAKGFEPEAYTLKAYAAVQVVAKGIEIAGKCDPKAVAKAIRSGAPIPTVLGTLTFDANGDRREPDVAWYVWKADGTGGYSPAMQE